MLALDQRGERMTLTLALSRTPLMTVVLMVTVPESPAEEDEEGLSSLTLIFVFSFSFFCFGSLKLCIALDRTITFILKTCTFSFVKNYNRHKTLQFIKRGVLSCITS